MQLENSQPNQKEGSSSEVPPTSAPNQLPPDLSQENPSFDSRVAYDMQRSALYVVGEKNSGAKVIVFNKQGERVSEIDLSAVLNTNESLTEQGSDMGSDSSEAKRNGSANQYGDNWSILRFVKGNNVKALDISPSGLTLKIVKTYEAKQQKEKEDIVLTNMAFSYGLHLWEIIATISCNNLWIGVYNPLTKKDFMASFKTTTPRVISVCLDLNENQVKFWLNDRRNSNKTIKLPDGGLWVPCVKIEKEKNKIYLNPFAREPSDFYEKDFDKKLNINKFILPFLQNMVCLTRLPQMSTVTKEAAHQLKEMFQLQASQLHQILVPQTSEGTALGDNQMFCFIQFHHYQAMVNFIMNYKDTDKCKLYEFHQIAQWFTSTELAPEVKDPYQLIQNHVKVPKVSISNCLTSIDDAFKGLQDLSETVIQGEPPATDIKITSQPFTDKIVCVKDNSLVKIISRDTTQMTFDIEGSNFSETPTQVDSLVLLRIKTSLVSLLFTIMNWSQIFKDESQEQAFGVISTFFNSLLHSKSIKGDYLFFKAPLIVAKFFTDLALQQTQAQLDRIRRNQNNYSTVISVNSPILRNKQEFEHEKIKSCSFFTDHNHSVEDLFMLKQTLTDLSEQMWGQARTTKCPPNVKSLLQSVSRPFSSLNRLGSFISFNLNNISAEELSENGFFYRESHSVSQFENQFIEITDLNMNNLTNCDVLQEYLGKTNRYLNSLVTENIPLYKSLNYLPSQSLFLKQIVDVISSQNSEFILFGDAKGNIKVCNSGLKMNTLFKFNFFELDNDVLMQNHVQAEVKHQLQSQNYDTFRDKLQKKSVPISVLKDFKPSKAQEKKAKNEIINQKKEEKKQAITAQSGVIKIEKKKKPTKIALKEKKKKLLANKSKYPLDSISQSTSTQDEKKDPPKQSDDKKDIEEIEKLEFPGEEKELPPKPQKPLKEENQVSVLGYILLTKPAFDTSLTPLNLGCIFYHLNKQKYFLRVRQLVYSLKTLQSQHLVDLQTGNIVNRINGKQFIETSNSLMNAYLDILKCRSNVIDLIPTFLRDYAYKDNLPKKDSTFNIFNPLHQTEIEIPCSSIVDFSRCSYSVNEQDTIHILVDKENKGHSLVQFQIRYLDSPNLSIKKIELVQTQSVEIDFNGIRVFQYDNKAVVVGEKQMSIMNQGDLKEERRIEMEQGLTKEEKKNLTLINETDCRSIFNKRNMKYFEKLEKVPQQQWVLLHHHPQREQKYTKFNLVESIDEKDQILNEDSQVQQDDKIDIQSCTPQDILQLGNLLECKFLGTMAYSNKDAYLTSSCIDPANQHYTHHSWHILNKKREDEYEFKIQIPYSKQMTQVRQIDIEFSFKKKDITQFKLEDNLVREGDSQDFMDNTWQFDQNKQQSRIPLTTEYVVGAQLNDNIQPCFLTTPDSKVFQANYSQPEIIFKHQHDELFVPTQFIIRSKEYREWNGVPISQGLIFISESLEPLMNTKQFAKFTEKEYTAWKNKRDQFKDIPLLPNEPIAFFDIGEGNEIKVDLYSPLKPCRFIKFIPTAFRKRPINFSSKPFNANQAECQFFGVNGFVLQAHGRGIQNQDNFKEHLQFKQELQFPINCDVCEDKMGKIGDIKEVAITELRGAKSTQMGIPISALQELKIKNLVGVGRTSLVIKEEYSNYLNLDRSESMMEQSKCLKSINNGQYQLLNSNFEIHKMNTVYSFKVDLQSYSLVQKLKLYFENDNKSLYKIIIRIIVPDREGKEEIRAYHSYDENTYTQVCDHGYLPTSIEYFNSPVDSDQSLTLNSNLLQDKCDLNCISIDLNDYLGRYMKIQIELMDTYRTVHKQAPYTQIFIRPEFYGSVLQDKKRNEQEFQKFKIKDFNDSTLMGSKTFDHLTYQIYKLDTNSFKHKSAIFVSSSNQTTIQKQESIDIQVLINQQENIKEFLRDYKKGLITQQVIKDSVTDLQKKLDQHNISFVERGEKLTLNYIFKLSDLLAQHLMIQSNLKTEILKERDCQRDYQTLFKHFTIFDQKNLHSGISKLQDLLFKEIKDKNQFILNLFNEFLCSPNHLYSQKGIIEFIKTHSPYNFNEIFGSFLKELRFQREKEAKVKSLEDFQGILDEHFQVQKEYQENTKKRSQVRSQQIMVILKIMEIVEINKDQNQKIDLGIVFRLLCGYLNSVNVKKLDDDKKTLLITYAFNVVLNYLEKKITLTDTCITDCLGDMLFTIQQVIQLNHKQSEKVMKETLKELMKLDLSGELIKGIHFLLQWYQNKDNMQKSIFYSTVEKEQPGLGTGQFYKHQSLVFKIYMKLLHKMPQTDSVKRAYNELGINDMLSVLIQDKDSENYEENYSVVWTQIYESLSYLNIMDLINKNIFDTIAEKFFCLSSLLQQSLYPKLHHQSERLLSEAPENCPLIIILLAKAFIKVGFKSQSNIKVAYCFVDGLFNILLTGKRDETSQDSVKTKLCSNSISELFKLLTNFLFEEVNYGVYNGMHASHVETIMKLDLALQMTTLLIHSKSDNPDQSLFTYFVKDSSIDKGQFEKLIDWLFLNYSPQKGKNSPAGSRSYSLSVAVEQILCTFSSSEGALAMALPILMKKVLVVDEQIRILSEDNSINLERSIQIQKNVNVLFLNLFKSWVHTDQIAKKFLMQLNGFDFLLNRLFSSKEEKGMMREDSDMVRQYSSEEDMSESEDEELFSSIKQKIFKTSQVNQEEKQIERKRHRSHLPSLSKVIMKKQTAIHPETSTNEGLDGQKEQTKDIEQALLIEDYARTMKIIWSSDKEKAVASMHMNIQWNKFKNGAKNKIYNYQITKQQHQYEYVVKFELEQLIQVNELQVGVLYNWSSYDQDLQYVPQTFLVEGGKNQDEVDWKIELLPVNDDGYKLNTITVYGHNFVEKHSQSTASLNEALSSIGCRECKYLTFKLRKPIMACLDNSLYVGSASKIKSYCFSFISVMGTKVVNSPVLPYIVDLQKENSLEVLSKFFSGEFAEAFQIISEQPSIIEKIKNAFDKLSSLLDSKAQLIKPIFLAICQKNKELGDWIMEHRLISIDDKLIKKEQIKFLGDIISSNLGKQLEKLEKLKSFIINEINLNVESNVQRTNDQRILLSRFIKLYNKKMREYASQIRSSFQDIDSTLFEGSDAQEEIQMQFTAKDLENSVSLMSQFNSQENQGKNALVKSLISFNLLLLTSPQPFINKTISINDYVEKLLSGEQNQLSNLLFCSIIASTSEKALDMILKQNKIEWVINQLQNSSSTSSNYQLTQIIYNLTKQEKFKETFRATLTFDFYRLLKEPKENKKLLKESYSQELIQLIVQTIKDLVIGSEDYEEALTLLLKEDMITASEQGDVEFINKVIVPILHAEHKMPISINLLETSKNRTLVKPIFSANEAQSNKGQHFFLKTEILNTSQKQAFQKSFKEISSDKVDNFGKMVDSKWELIYEDKNLTQDTSKFRKFVQAVQNKSNVILLANCNLNGQKAIFGGYCSKPFPTLGETWAHEFDYQVPFSEGNFVFYYTAEKNLHFTMLHNKPFGYIYTDYEEGGALSISGDFFLISWSYEFQNSCGNIYDMKCIEEPSIMTFYSNMEVLGFEVWWCNTGVKADLEDGKVKSELKKHALYKDFSPYNFFRENLIFEVNSEMNLSQVAREILGKHQVFIRYPLEDEIPLKTKVQEFQYQTQDGIIDLYVKKSQQELKQSEPLEEEKKDETSKSEQTPIQAFTNLIDSHSKFLNQYPMQVIPSFPPIQTIQPVQKLLPSLSLGGLPLSSFPPPSNLFGSSNIDIDILAQPQPLTIKPKIQTKVIGSNHSSQKYKKSRSTSPTKRSTFEEEKKVQTFIPHQPILKKFEEKGGIFDLIKAAKAALKQYKNDKIKEMWSLWLSEIESFSQLPQFFQTFCQDHDKETIIYNLLDGQYDVAEQQKDTNAEANKLIQQQEELHIEMVKYSYKIVNQVFEKHLGADLREQCLKNGTLAKFIERVGQLSSEKRRYKETKSPDGEQESTSDQGAEPKSHKKTISASKKDNKRKGVGYTTGVGTTWNVSEYLKSKEAKSAQISNIVSIIKHFIRTKDWESPPEIKDLLLESAMLPTVEAAFRSGSLLEMAKDFDLNISYLDFVQEIAQHPNLLTILLDIGDEYKPKQKESIQSLLEKLQNLSKIFLGCLTVDQKNSSQTDENTEKPKKLAEKIEETHKIVTEKVQQQIIQNQKQSLEEILSMPVEQAYHKLLSDLRFDYMSMKDSVGILQHYYQNEISKNQTPTTSKLVRLAQEIADLSNSLPCHSTDAIFCRVDKDRVDLMKVIIMGASGTPYAHGAFIYDLFFDNSYPQTPPKCQLVTTGGQTVRFNPNLYHNGKVCLSLLGTWRGSATENWDPKLSTILQVLLSIQAIIMSNEVYFNEPGYEHEAGTSEGERKNEGYANIVRYCNIKFAMIEQIKNPPSGFEKVIRRSYYLKKNDILREVKEWVDKAKTTDALYTGLVYDHNYQWAPQISQEGKYAEMMENIYKELKVTLESIQSPFEDESGLKLERKFSKVQDQVPIINLPQQVDLNDVDVSYEPESGASKQQTMSVDDDKVKDRWSRYIGAMGIEAVAKQAESKILISSLSSLGIEIAKNIVLAGCKELFLYDTQVVKENNWQGNFFLNSTDVVKNQSRADLCKDKIQQLNFYVKVSVVKDSDQFKKIVEEDKELKVVVLTQTYTEDNENLIKINQICRKRGVAFILGNQNGLFGQLFNDFGDEFIVLDKNGEDLQEVVLKDITLEEEAIVTLLEGYKHTFEDGDQVQFKNIEGMVLLEDPTKSINDTIHTIKVINPTSFKIGSTLSYSKLEKGGIAKQVKVPKKVQFKSLEENLNAEIDNVGFDQNMIMQDFEKMDNFKYTHLCYQWMQKLLKENKKFKINESDIWERSQLFMAQYFSPLKDMSENQLKAFQRFAQIFSITFDGNLPPLSAYLGGFMAQEVIKAITQKFSPINQYLYCDAIELFPINDEVQKSDLRDLLALDPLADLQFNLRICLGNSMIESLEDCNLFMIGAGAIGCELLKNFSMLSIGTGEIGKIIVTDPDIIEVSNLNRQFLFREKHLRKPKSATAAAAAIQMNPRMKGHIEARMDKICEATKNIYNEEFFQKQTIVTNALDNVQARLFIDHQCVTARVGMIDSGTLGPKGHVQMVIPLETESYASQRDPEDNLSIPQCTLKMFPEETLHCVELAKDIFGNMFTLNPKSFNKVVIDEADKEINFSDQQELVVIKKIIKLVEKKPEDFEQCLLRARQKFQKYFCNDIKQLLHVYPKDRIEKNGKPFWSLPKRTPIPIEFDPENALHCSFISALACLYATIYKIPISNDQPRSKESKTKMGQVANTFKMPQFVPNDQKASQIASEVEKEQNKQEQAEQAEEQQENKFDVETIKKKFKQFVQPLKDKHDVNLKMQVEEFEKDNDDNFHIDFIYSFANIRASNYSLEPMDWITVKLKAGRIIPALATTTAAIAGLQTLEMLKYLSNCKVAEHRNSFLNLAVPSLMMSEPGAPVKHKIKEGLEVTIWDRWEYDADQQSTLSEVLTYLESQYKLESRDVFHGSVPVIIHAMGAINTQKITKTLKEVLEIEGQPKFVDLTVTFVDPDQEGENGEKKIIEGIPPVRVFF